MSEKDKGSYTLLGIVAIVAIVGLVMMFKGGAQTQKPIITYQTESGSTSLADQVLAEAGINPNEARNIGGDAVILYCPDGSWREVGPYDIDCAMSRYRCKCVRGTATDWATD